MYFACINCKIRYIIPLSEFLIQKSFLFAIYRYWAFVSCWWVVLLSWFICEHLWVYSTHCRINFNFYIAHIRKYLLFWNFLIIYSELKSFIPFWHIRFNFCSCFDKNIYYYKFILICDSFTRIRIAYIITKWKCVRIYTNYTKVLLIWASLTYCK